MTFPTIADADTKTGTVTSNSTSWTLTYPTNIAANDLLVGLLASDGNQTSTTAWPSGWVGLLNTSGGAVSLYSVLKVTNGSESGTFSVGTIANEQGSWWVGRIPASSWYGTLGGLSSISTTSEFSQTGAACRVATTGGSANPDVTALDPGQWDVEDTLWISFCAADTSRTISVYPSSPDTFTNTGSLVSGGSTGATLGYCRLEKAAASVEPGAYTISASDDWIAGIFAIRPAGAAAPANPLRSTQMIQLLAH